MYLYLLREPTVAGSTLGSLYVEGRRVCDTLEDALREVPGEPVETWKIPGQTAIPAGRYRVRWTWSPTFNRQCPELVDVPGFSGIRIHAGITPEDTQGCLLVGFSRAGTAAEPGAQLRNALPARHYLDRLVERAHAGGEAIWIRIENPRTSDVAPVA